MRKILALHCRKKRFVSYLYEVISIPNLFQSVKYLVWIFQIFLIEIKPTLETERY